jgi:hypothetical protein
LPRILTVKTREAYFAVQLRYTDFFLNGVQQTRKTAAEEKKETHMTGGGLILSIINKKKTA